MVKTDVLEELKILCLKEKTTLNKAMQGICFKSSLYRTINNGSVIAKNINDLAESLGYDIEITFVKKV